MLTSVIVDNREPSNIQSLQFGGIPKVVMTLETGDLWAATDDGEMLVIERKTPSDLLNSIKDGRLFQQVAAMRERSKWSYVMVTGALTHTLDGHVICDNRTTGFRFDDALGALLSVQEMGVCVMYCQSDSHYEEAVIRLARRERGAEKSIAPRMKAAILSPAETILISLPGIGLQRAKDLLERFDTAGHAIQWLTWLNSVEEVGGIGDGTKHNVRKALGLNGDEWITVFYPAASEYAASQLGNNEPTTHDLGVLSKDTLQPEARRN